MAAVKIEKNRRYFGVKMIELGHRLNTGILRKE